MHIKNKCDNIRRLKNAHISTESDANISLIFSPHERFLRKWLQSYVLLLEN